MLSIIHLLLVAVGLALTLACCKLVLARARHLEKVRIDLLRASLDAVPGKYEYDPKCSRIRFMHRGVEVVARVESYRSLPRAEGHVAENHDVAFRVSIVAASGAPDFVLVRSNVQLPPPRILPETRVPQHWGADFRAYAMAPEWLGRWMHSLPSFASLGCGAILELSVERGLASVAVEGELTDASDLIRLADLVYAAWSGSHFEPRSSGRLQVRGASLHTAGAFATATILGGLIGSMFLVGPGGRVLESVIRLDEPARSVEIPALAQLAQIVVAFSIPYCVVLLLFVAINVLYTRRTSSSTAPQPNPPTAPYR